MKMYLGSYMDIFCVTYLTLITLTPPLFAIAILMTEINIATACIAVGLVGVSLLFGYQFFKLRNQILSWGTFDEKGVLVKTIFKKPFFIEYSKCKDVGVAFYIQAMYHSGAGNKVRYIYLSYDVVKKKDLSRITMVKNDTGFVKIKCCSKSYQYLINTLPYKQKTMLCYAYNNKTGDGSVS